MKKRYLYAAWAALYIVCAGLSFIPEPAGAVRVCLTAVSALFFLPPVWLLWRACREQDRSVLQLLRNLSLGSLGLTLAAMVLNIIFVTGSRMLGNFLHAVLAIVSVPMIAGGYWIASLFAWAVILAASVSALRR